MTSHLLPPDRRDERLSLRQAALYGIAAIVCVAVLVVFPPQRLLGSVFGVSETSSITTASAAFGESGELRIQLKLPGEVFEFPVDIRAASGSAKYQWVRATDSVAVTADTALVGSEVTAPPRAGLYHLAVTAGGTRTVLDDVVLAVLVPFSEKVGSTINGYRIGTYQNERGRPDNTPPPPGFIEVWPDYAAMWVTDHLQLADFLAHDGQDRWPRYLALDRRLLDKVELVLDRLGARERVMDVSVHSGFRTPLHNLRVPRAASDSRHQYGDAIDLAIDADGDGRVSYFDILAIARAVELVERDYPGLVGGMGVYGNRSNVPYVHIDVRGERKRWRG
ncbi:MAG: DUF882 domain-containing protein [Gemmatimonadetes bacterium]|nr:DUF882 domain-containing protein [Gemmatimonadota bacterium]